MRTRRKTTPNSYLENMGDSFSCSCARTSQAPVIYISKSPLLRDHSTDLFYPHNSLLMDSMGQCPSRLCRPHTHTSTPSTGQRTYPFGQVPTTYDSSNTGYQSHGPYGDGSYNTQNDFFSEPGHTLQGHSSSQNESSNNGKSYSSILHSLTLIRSTYSPNGQRF